MRPFIYAAVVVVIGFVLVIAPSLVRRRLFLLFSWPANDSAGTLRAIRVVGVGVLVIAAVIAYLLATTS